MARKPRVEFAGTFYHVICRGNQRQAIFRSDRDRTYYLDRLEHYRGRYGFALYAYVRMVNHVHLHLETGHSGPWPHALVFLVLQVTVHSFVFRH
jgi:REP element-mobilizing transposase RayT